MLWRFEIQQWDDPATRVGLRGANLRKVNLRLRSPHSVSFTMNGLHRQAPDINMGETDVLVSLGSTDVVRARCTSDLDNVGPTRHGVNFTFADYRAVLQRRKIYASDTSVMGTQTKTQQAWIEDLIAVVESRANGDYGITTSAQVMSPFNREWTVKEGQFVGKIIEEMSNTDPKFNWDFNNSLQLQTWNTRGQLRSLGLFYGPGGNVEQFSRSRVSNNYANDALFTGSQGTTPEQRVSATVATDPRGRWDAVASYPDISVQGTLVDRADAGIEDMSSNPSTYSVKLRKKVWEGTDQLNVGDTIDRIALKSGRINDVVEGARVLEIAVDVLDAGEEDVSLIIEVPT